MRRTTIRTTTAIAMPVDLGGRLRYARECAGLRPEKVALEIGRTARVLGDWERNYRPPRLVYLRQLAELYDVPIAELVDVEVITRCTDQGRRGGPDVRPPSPDDDSTAA